MRCTVCVHYPAIELTQFCGIERKVLNAMACDWLGNPSRICPNPINMVFLVFLPKHSSILHLHRPMFSVVVVVMTFWKIYFYDEVNYMFGCYWLRCTYHSFTYDVMTKRWKSHAHTQRNPNFSNVRHSMLQAAYSTRTILNVIQAYLCEQMFFHATRYDLSTIGNTLTLLWSNNNNCSNG